MRATPTAADSRINPPQTRWLGIDFSGDNNKWSTRCSKSNVWIAEITPSGQFLRLASLKRVQELRGDGSPFARLSALLSKRDFLAAAVDAPFSVPADFLSSGGHKELLEGVAGLSVRKSFPAAQTFADSIVASRPMVVPKPLRRTERSWQQNGVNVRSTLWTGPRGGAAMTAECLYLLSKAGCPIWPWTTDVPGLLAEAFPAAQLKHWKLPFQRYNDQEGLGTANRKTIVAFLESRWLEIGEFKQKLLESADAIDAVLCAFAAKAVSQGELATQLEAFDDEGQIAIHA
jgi:predicted nuclease with RNAse H fold